MGARRRKTTGSAAFQHVTTLRVRYSETDQMGTFYNSRALEWFECARTELLRAAGIAYAEMERRGCLLPLVEAHVNYTGRARYDDELLVAASAAPAGKVRLRFDISITNRTSGALIVTGYTVHAVTDPAGKPIRIPDWVLNALTAADPACGFCKGQACIGACRD